VGRLFKSANERAEESRLILETYICAGSKGFKGNPVHLYGGAADFDGVERATAVVAGCRRSGEML